MEHNFQLKLVSGMTKARLDDQMVAFPVHNTATALCGDRFFFSALASVTTTHAGVNAYIHVESELAPFITTYVVEHVPVRLPHRRDRADLDYMDHAPGLYPDVLRPTNRLYLMDMLHQIVFELNTPQDLAPGVYPIDVVLRAGAENEEVARETFTLEVLDAVLPAQELILSTWFHCDCLADYYHVEIFSERHWEIIESFLRCYVERGMNAVLTPIFTPPLDTVVGSERPTVQLVDVICENGKYSFGFEKLARFCEMCLRVGIQDLELAHFFTQWGAAHAPKIMATVDGEYRRIFGWETEATSDAYIGFLREFIPAVKEKLDEFGFKDHYYFHISDEPNETNLENYAAAKNAIWELISDHPLRDALGRYDFYERGIVSEPIVATNHMEEFLAHGSNKVLVYYCCSQAKNVSNRFIAMPGYRARVLGAQLYRTDVMGFQSWNFNFYYSKLSQYLINPYLINDGDYAYPAGDAFIVYPEVDGTPLLSLREVVFEQGLWDVRAMKAAEARVGREAVLAAVEAEGKIDFTHYPRNEAYLLKLRDTVNRMAAQA